jgi:hypothetical protein
MDSEYLGAAVKAMREQGIAFAPGLTAGQIEAAEVAHRFRFPPDLRALLEYALPLGERFPDWRLPASEFIRDRLAWPADSMCFDIEHNTFWMSAWGPKPDSLEAAQARARQAVRAAPFLVPISGHRYLPAVPCKAGNPVFSVYQTDIIYYGLDLPSYLCAEFKVPNSFPLPDAPRHIEFWSELERLNNE